jgi:tetratricopeptide (TPR) repeat protein
MAHDMVGRSLLLQGRTAEAIPRFEEALGISPNLPGMRNRLGLAYWKTGRGGEAAAQFREAVRLNPSFAPARYNLGLLAADLRDWGLAREQYQALKALGIPEAGHILQRLPHAERSP